jgi:glycosyltransferase involved in cell wall biosynthesis
VSEGEDCVTAVASLFPGIYVDHPVGPIEPRDPLPYFEGRWQGQDLEASGRRLSIAFAARWERLMSQTWSGSAAGLLGGMRDVADVDDIGLHLPSYVRQALRIAYIRYRNGRIDPVWRHSRLYEAYLGHAVQGQFAKGRYDATLSVDSITDFSGPSFIFYDCAWDVMAKTETSPKRYTIGGGVSMSVLSRMTARQNAIYENVDGIFAMSQWFANCLIEKGLPASKVHLVHPGTNIDVSGDVLFRERPRRKLLYIGRSSNAAGFYRKGGDLVVEAFSILRKEYDPELTLTMAGVRPWPAVQEIPEGVTVLGVCSTDEIRKLYDSHDLFVMPSRLECFGIVFAEAQARGLPCVGRNAYAMPEIIVPGLSGALTPNNDPRELADAIAGALDDDKLYDSCHQRAPHVAEYFSWRRAAREVNSLICSAIT